MARVTMPDAGALLVRALLVDAVRHGIAAEPGAWRSHPWASATFVGERHRGTLHVAGDEAASWVAMLPEAEFAIRGHLVADLAARWAGDGTVAVEALTLVAA